MRAHTEKRAHRAEKEDKGFQAKEDLLVCQVNQARKVLKGQLDQLGPRDYLDSKVRKLFVKWSLKLAHN